MNIEVTTGLIGEYQGENITLAAAILLELGVDVKAVITGVKALAVVPGRMDAVDCGQPFTVLVDYAHTPQALSKALSTIRPLCKSDLTVVFGCGGDRDKIKRPEMGRVVAERADRVIITNDNPRTEDPLQIIDDILEGVPAEFKHKVAIEPDRGEAINLAIKNSSTHDVVVIAGKGAESHQIIGESRHSFDDRSVARNALSQAGWS